ncbi:hypothetical protein BDV18DRAFT_143280 [Aspergillus unguis]
MMCRLQSNWVAPNRSNADDEIEELTRQLSDIRCHNGVDKGKSRVEEIPDDDVVSLGLAKWPPSKSDGLRFARDNGHDIETKALEIPPIPNRQIQAESKSRLEMQPRVDDPDYEDLVDCFADDPGFDQLIPLGPNDQLHEWQPLIQSMVSTTEAGPSTPYPRRQPEAEREVLGSHTCSKCGNSFPAYMAWQLYTIGVYCPGCTRRYPGMATESQRLSLPGFPSVPTAGDCVQDATWQPELDNKEDGNQWSPGHFASSRANPDAHACEIMMDVD